MEKQETERESKMLPKVVETRCRCCSNHCALTVNIFPDGRRLISGNHCSRPLSGKNSAETYDFDSFEYRRALLARYMEGGKGKGKRGKLGIPMSLLMYEYLPLFYQVFSELGFDVVVSPLTTPEMLEERGASPCLPTRIMKAHIEYLLEQGVDKVFVPAISSVTVKENIFQNCPILAYQGTTLKDERIVSTLMPIGKEKEMAIRISEVFNLPRKDVKEAMEEGFEELKKFRKKLSKVGSGIAKKAKKDNRKVVVVASRPYHLDPVIFHELDKMLLTLGVSVIGSESLGKLIPTTLDNYQSSWLGHIGIHNAALTVSENKGMGLVLINTPGCGLDTVTSSDVTSVLGKKGKKPLILTLSPETGNEEIFQSLMEFIKSI